ncbi:MAG: hypothetical protein HY661_11255 [Betaproteobacteria bacterium]|nr:hypothetical protein [Betaproteobacteria bacterium]
MLLLCAAAGEAQQFDTFDWDTKVFPLLDDYFAGIKNELNQADRLSGDAVGELVASFKHIGNLTRSQQDIALAIAAAALSAEPMGPLLERQTMIAGQIEREVDAAVTALQFGDLVAQLLDHAMVRVDAIGAALQRIASPDAAEDAGEPKPRQFHEAVSKAVMLANSASRGRPAIEHGMQTGAIELF